MGIQRKPWTPVQLAVAAAVATTTFAVVYDAYTRRRLRAESTRETPEAAGQDSYHRRADTDSHSHSLRARPRKPPSRVCGRLATLTIPCPPQSLRQGSFRREPAERRWQLAGALDAESVGNTDRVELRPWRRLGRQRPSLCRHQVLLLYRIRGVAAPLRGECPSSVRARTREGPLFIPHGLCYGNSQASEKLHVAAGDVIFRQVGKSTCLPSPRPYARIYLLFYWLR
jgi:hypothetical protein